MEVKTRDDAVQDLVNWYFQRDPDFVSAYRFVSSEEDSSDEPVKLLEVNKAVLSDSEVTPFVYRETETFPYPLALALVSPEQFARIESRVLPLPEGWNPNRMQKIKPTLRMPRPRHLGIGGKKHRRARVLDASGS